MIFRRMEIEFFLNIPFQMNFQLMFVIYYKIVYTRKQKRFYENSKRLNFTLEREKPSF
jgi:hypothetical protein